MASSESLRVGQTVGGKYRLLRESARSGDLGGVASAAAVFEAEHVWTGKRFTLKVLQVQAGASLETRFVREARAASALVHPNVVKVYDVDRDADGALYQVQELLEGETLEERLKTSRKLSLDVALDLLLPVMDALALAHDVGVVHRDVRPATIFFSRRHDGSIVPKLIDFGVSKLLGASGGSLEHSMTINNSSIGNVAYMSPERLTSPQIDASVDVWAMAVVLYETLSGRTPFVSKNLSEMSVMIATRDAPHLWERAPELAPEVGAVVDRALVRKRDGRTTEMTVLVADLCTVTGRELPEKSESLIDALAPVHVDTDGLPTPAALQVLAPVEAPRPPQRDVERPVTLSSSGESRVARLRLGVVGDPDAEVGLSTEDRLDRALMARTALVRVPTYADLVDALTEKRVDIAWLAPMAYARAKELGAVGLFEVDRGGRRDPRALLVGRSPRVRSWDDLAGARAAWVDPWSTSGYALQRRALIERGVDPAIFSAQAFLGTHEAVGIALATGRADVGGMVGSFDRDKNEVTGSWPEDASIVVLAMSDKLPSEVIAIGPAHASHAELLRTALRNAGVSALASLIGAEALGQFQPVDESRYEGLLDRESIVRDPPSL
jgi:ABC-type phosphate/phosphonate transport system substrate-binding protein